MKSSIERSPQVIATLVAFAFVAANPIVARAETVTLAATLLTGATPPNTCSLRIAIYSTRVAATVYYRQANDTLRTVNANLGEFVVRASTDDKSKIGITNKVGTFTARGTFTELGKDPINVNVEVTADVNKNWVDIVVKNASGAVLKTISGTPSSEAIRVQWAP